jgi:hypothetical protein
MLTPASAATSLRRSPGTPAVGPGGQARLPGVILARRETRKLPDLVAIVRVSTARPAAHRWAALPVQR